MILEIMLKGIQLNFFTMLIHMVFVSYLVPYI